VTKPVPAAPVQQPAAPAGETLYAVGDIHGRLDLLTGVLAELRKAGAAGRGEGRKVTAVFLGDYIDRGPDARGVIEALRAFAAEGACEVVFLRGNHEQMLLDLIDGDLQGTEWLSYGGVETLRSYGVEQSAQLGAGEAARLPARLAAWIPAAHVAFLRDTRLTFEGGDYLFVHAGLRPDRLLDEQSDADKLWYRYYSDEPPIHGKTVVHGHTPRERPIVSRWRLGIDTEAYASDALTAVRLEGDRREFLKFEPAADGAGVRAGVWEESDQFAERPKRRSVRARSGAIPVVSWLSGPGPRIIGAVAVLVLLIGAAIGLAERFGGRLRPRAPPAAHSADHQTPAVPDPAAAIPDPAATDPDPPAVVPGQATAIPHRAANDPPAAGAARVQVGALPSAALAREAGERARRAAPAGSAAHVEVEKVVTPSGATLYRSYLAGFAASEAAASFCRQAAAAGIECLVRKGAG
jgi:serine/threonine protein phosphatase 1